MFDITLETTHNFCRLMPYDDRSVVIPSQNKKNHSDKKPGGVDVNI